MASLSPAPLAAQRSTPAAYSSSRLAAAPFRSRRAQAINGAPVAARVVRAAAASAPSSEAATSAELPVARDDPNFCGPDGRVLVREPGGGPPAAGWRGTYHIHTYGCQMNVADSERMAGQLEFAGYSPVAAPDIADVLVYNTCSIREHAEQKVYSALGRQAERKRRSPGLKIVVAGCVAAHAGASLLRRVPEVDLVIGPHHAGRLAELLDRVDAGHQVCAVDEATIDEDVTSPVRGSTVCAWVNVIYGCNERCTYCVVPLVRGREQSRDPDAIKREVYALGEAGYKEVTLLGQNIDAYGRDLPGSATDGSGRRAWTLADLLAHVHDAPGIERIRFATSHPRYFSERLIHTCAGLPKVARHFHVPFQSGDDDILKTMGRGYTVDRFRRIMAAIRAVMPDASLSADAIAGFPGETEAQFQGTLDLIAEIGFDYVTTAAYSPRPGTPAATWPNQVAELVKDDRLQRLNAAVGAAALGANARYAGRTEPVLVEGPNPRNAGQLMGRTSGNRPTFFAGGRELIGRIVPVRITDVRPFSLTGTVEL